MALARSGAVNERGETAACRAAATTSSLGASFGTNAEAPASRAANRCSSPAYMVSTTRPMSGRWPRSGLDDVEAAAVGQPDVADDDVGLELGRRDAWPRRTDEPSADDREVRVAVECAAQTLTNQVVVIDEQHGVGHGFLQIEGVARGLRRGAGLRRQRCLHRDGSPMVRTALMRSARSFMMCRP